MRCLINQLASPGRYLHRIAERSLKAVHSRALKEPHMASTIIKNLMGSNGDISFDLITKTKTIEKLLTSIDLSDLETIVTLFSQLIMHPQVQDDKSASAKRQALAEYLVTVVRSKSNQNRLKTAAAGLRDAIIQILDILIQHAYFDIGENSDELNSSPKPPISQVTRQMFRSRITSCLTHLISRATDISYYPYYVVSKVQVKKTFAVFRADQGVDEEINRACETLKKIHEKENSAKKSRKTYFQSFKLLYSLMLLQVYNGDADAVNILSELKECYQDLLKHPNANKKGESSEILVEIILGLVSKPSLLFKRLAQQVFSTCTSTITAESILSMVRVSGRVSILFLYYGYRLTDLGSRDQ